MLHIKVKNRETVVIFRPYCQASLHLHMFVSLAKCCWSSSNTCVCLCARVPRDIFPSLLSSRLSAQTEAWGDATAAWKGGIRRCCYRSKHVSTLAGQGTAALRCVLAAVWRCFFALKKTHKKSMRCGRHLKKKRPTLLRCLPPRFQVLNCFSCSYDIETEFDSVWCCNL